jgi:hypothetical protein
MKSTHILVFSSFMFLMACKTDDKTVHHSTNLKGHWDIVNAELNGQESPALDKIYYEFGTGDSLKTNFTLSEQDETGTFTVKENRIIQNTAQPIEFQIINKTDSTLEMTTALRGFDFKLNLKKTY